MSAEKTTILHLDDHKLFRDAIGHSLMEQMRDVDYLVYESSIVAFKDIETMFANGLPLDLIITDYNHPGPPGDKFAVSVRELDVKFKRSTPILMLTTVSEDHPEIVVAIKEKVINKYLHKLVEPVPLKKAVQQLIGRKA